MIPTAIKLINYKFGGSICYVPLYVALVFLNVCSFITIISIYDVDLVNLGHSPRINLVDNNSGKL